MNSKSFSARSLAKRYLYSLSFNRKTVLGVLVSRNSRTVFSGDGSLAPVVTGLAPSSSVVTSGSPRETLLRLFLMSVSRKTLFRLSSITIFLLPSFCSFNEIVILFLGKTFLIDSPHSMTTILLLLMASLRLLAMRPTSFRR